jgi:hypothetical protein
MNMRRFFTKPAAVGEALASPPPSSSLKLQLGAGPITGSAASAPSADTGAPRAPSKQNGSPNAFSPLPTPAPRKAGTDGG